MRSRRAHRPPRRDEHPAGRGHIPDHAAGQGRAIQPSRDEQGPVPGGICAAEEIGVRRDRRCPYEHEAEGVDDGPDFCTDEGRDMSGRDPSMEWTGQIENERPYLLRFARMRLRDPDAAEDAVQDTLLVALAGRTPFLGRSSLRTWLTSILNHKIMDVYRKNASDRARGYSYGGDSDATGIQKMEHDVLDNIDAGQHQPDAELERKQLARQLMAAIHSLPARQRDVFMLYQMSGCSGDEIAKTVGLSNSNVWVMLHRARKVLRAELQEVYQRKPPVCLNCVPASPHNDSVHSLLQCHQPCPKFSAVFYAKLILHENNANRPISRPGCRFQPVGCSELNGQLAGIKRQNCRINLS